MGTAAMQPRRCCVMPVVDSAVSRAGTDHFNVRSLGSVASRITKVYFSCVGLLYNVLSVVLHGCCRF